MPLSLLTGRKDVMALLDKDVFFFTTFGGEALSLAAAKATIGVLRDEGVPAALARTGARLRDGYLAAAKAAGCDFTRCFGMDARTIVTFDPKAGNPLELKSLLQQEMIKRGVLWSGFHNVSFAHTDADVEHTLAAYREALPIVVSAVQNGVVRKSLRGAPVEPVFRKTSNFNLKPKV
jgi:glutamate-1-semialdehyde 2,1-aminomutase